MGYEPRINGNRPALGRCCGQECPRSGNRNPVLPRQINLQNGEKSGKSNRPRAVGRPVIQSPRFAGTPITAVAVTFEFEVSMRLGISVLRFGFFRSWESYS